MDPASKKQRRRSSSVRNATSSLTPKSDKKKSKNSEQVPPNSEVGHQKVPDDTLSKSGKKMPTRYQMERATEVDECAGAVVSKSANRRTLTNETVELKVSPSAAELSAKYSKGRAMSGVTIRRRPKSYSCVVDDNDRDDFPMFMAMADLCVTPTGFFDVKEREEICRKIRVMSGEVSMAYTNRTTHVLAAHANTSKVEIGKDRNIPVVPLEWIEVIWDACQQNNPYVHASLPEYRPVNCPLFYNLFFVFSKHYDLNCKQFYEQIITANGGYLTTSLKKTANFFYVCQEPEQERLYQYAQAKEIACVPLAWIMESLNKGNLAKIEDFKIQGKELTGFGTTFNLGEPDTDAARLSLSMPTSKYHYDSRANDHSKLIAVDQKANGTDIDPDNTMSTTLTGDATGMETDSNKSDDSINGLDDTIVEAEEPIKDGLVVDAFRTNGYSVAG